ncbi:hypothetical protein LTR29_010055 [Friedmanniomyces endolithicus]|nr:hypothetical protein LTR29_010055 [Friedmanniomyces endolithicus]
MATRTTTTSSNAQPAPIPGGVSTPRTYKTHLTPFLHRAFLSAALLALGPCYISAIFMSPSTTLWSLNPIGMTGLRTFLLFVPVLAVFIIRVMNLHVGKRTTTSMAETLYIQVAASGIKTAATVGWYAFSAWMFGEVYIWSRSRGADLGWVDMGIAGYERPTVNENPILLRSVFVVLAVGQAVLHLARDYDRIAIEETEGRASQLQAEEVSRLPEPMQLLAQQLWPITGKVARLVVPGIVFSIPIYFMFIRRPAWNYLAYPIARVLVRQLPPNNGPTAIMHPLTLLWQALTASTILVILWELSNAIFTIHVSQPPLKRSADVYTLLRSWLRDERMGRWTIVLDNADDAGFLVERDSRTGRNLLEHLPIVEHGTVLITSRSNAAAARLVDRRDMIDVHPMDEEHALILLGKRLGQQTNRTELLALASALDFMPLAITQATAYIQKAAPRCSVPQYLEQLERSSLSKTNLLSANSEELRRDHEAKNSIMLALQISFDHIHKFRRSAADLLSLMSFYHHQEIPEFLLQITPDKWRALPRPLPSVKKVSSTFARLFRRKSRNPSINASVMEARTAGDEHGATEASYGGPMDQTFEQDIITLREYHFISVSPGGATFEMHRLVQLAAKLWLKASGRYRAWAERSIRNLDAAFPDPKYENWGKCRILYPHANLASDLKLSGRDGSLPLASILYKAAQFMLEQGQLEAAEAMDRRALDIRERILGKEDFNTLASFNNLALVFKKQGKYEVAEVMYRQVLEASERVLGKEHPDTLTSVNNLAVVLHQQEARESVLGKEHPNTLSSLNNLASVLQQQGKYEAAETMLRRVLKARERVPGKEHPDTLTSVNNLANVQQQQGKYEAAEAMFRQVLEACERVLGNEHPDTFRSVWSLAGVLHTRHQYDEAMKLYERAHFGLTKSLGSSHPDTVGCFRVWTRAAEDSRVVEAAEAAEVAEAAKSVEAVKSVDAVNSVEATEAVEACRQQKQ